MTATQQSRLFTPYRLRDLELANRIVVSPMCQYSAEDGSATDWHMMHLGTMAQSGAGLLIVEATGVEPEGRITHSCLGLYSDANEQALKRVVDACRKHGQAKLGIQLGHAGRKASSKVPWEAKVQNEPVENVSRSAGSRTMPLDARSRRTSRRTSRAEARSPCCTPRARASSA